ncbi:MAG: XrtA-associated tyrosine autokinase [Rhodospirillaceae bacterium]
MDIEALRERFATPDPRETAPGHRPGAAPVRSRPKPAQRRGAENRSPAAGDEGSDAAPRRRRGVLGSTWAVIRFLLIGSKRPRTVRGRSKPPAARAPRRPPRKLPAWMGRIGRRFRRLFPKAEFLERIPLPARLRALSLRHGIVRNVALLRGAENEPTVNEKALDAARRRYAAADTHFRRPLDLTARVGRTVEIDLDAVHAGGMVTPFGERTQIAEEFRLIKRPLLLNAFEKGKNAIRNGNVIMVASSRSGEGKTFTAINLAMSIATERDLTVLLIDADVAKPDIPHVLGFEADIGLVDLIADERIEVSDVIFRTNIDNLSVMSAGRPHHLATELLASERMAQLVSELSLRYPERVVVMDSPPALLSSVAGVLALNVGQILFVVEAERTSQTAVDSAIGLVSACKNINLLLNKSRSIGGSERFGSYYSGYY